MKKLVILTLALVTLCCLFVLPTAAYSDGELIWSEDFENAKSADYADSYDNYDVVIENGKMNLLCFTGSKFYKLPIPADVAGLNKFTVVYDWEVVIDEDGDTPRTKYITPDQLTNNALVFCERVALEGYTPMVYANKKTAVWKYDLSRMQHIDIWFAEYSDTPTYSPSLEAVMNTLT